ncbi:MAG: hypothetical protein WDO19_18865 [Bacteroidota bacterium]
MLFIKINKLKLHSKKLVRMKIVQVNRHEDDQGNDFRIKTTK